MEHLGEVASGCRVIRIPERGHREVRARKERKPEEFKGVEKERVRGEVPEPGCVAGCMLPFC